MWLPQTAAAPMKFGLRPNEMCLRHVKFSLRLSEIAPLGR